MALRPGCGRWLPALPRATPQRQDNLGVTWPQDRFAAGCLPDAPDAPAKPVHFWGASLRGGFRKQPAEPAGLAEPTHERTADRSHSWLVRTECPHRTLLCQLRVPRPVDLTFACCQRSSV